MADSVASLAPEGIKYAAKGSGRCLGSPLAYKVAYVFGSASLRILFRFEITGRDAVPASGPYVVVANHLNWLDAFALLLALPRDPRPHFLGWDGILKAPKLAWLIRTSQAGFIPVPRDPAMRSSHRRELHDRLRDHLRNGDVLAFFPEGTAGPMEGQLAPLRPGFARLALAAGVPVVPIALSGTRILWLRKRIRIVIGLPISPYGLEKEDLIKRAEAALKEMMSPYGEPGDWRLFRRKLTILIPSLTNWTRSDF